MISQLIPFKWIFISDSMWWYAYSASDIEFLNSLVKIRNSYITTNSYTYFGPLLWNSNEINLLFIQMIYWFILHAVFICQFDWIGIRLCVWAIAVSGLFKYDTEWRTDSHWSYWSGDLFRVARIFSIRLFDTCCMYFFVHE